MPSPAARILECLEALQDRPTVTGPELAERLRVDPRTVRRYVATLVELGIPVAADRGAAGGYRLEPGYRLPPLMLDDDEAAVVVLGLLAARDAGLDTAEPAAERALSKVLRVLPSRLRARVEALSALVASTAAPAEAVTPAGTLLDLAEAIGRGRRITCRYTRHDGNESARELTPLGLVAHGDRWYLAAHDHGRDGLRTFRADRIRGLKLTGSGVPAPPGFDVTEHVRRSLAEVPWTWRVVATLDLPHDEAARRVPPTQATLVADGQRTRLTMRVEQLDYMARVLAGLDCDFVVHEPPELGEHLLALATRLQAGTRASCMTAAAGTVTWSARAVPGRVVR